MTRRTFAWLALIGLATASVSVVAVQVGPAGDTATIIIHHFERPIGQEQYRLTRNDGDVTLTSKLEYVDRGVRVELVSLLRLGANLSPSHFAAKGKTYRFVNVDVEVAVDDGTARIRNLGQASTRRVPDHFFAARGYAPLAARTLLIEYWERNGRPRELMILPDGSNVTIEARGMDSVRVGGRTVQLRRYSVDGVVWGREAVWVDERGRFAAVLTRIHILPLEAVREDLRESLSALQASAVRDRMVDLTRLTERMRPLAQGSFALSGGRLIDGTGRRAIDDAVVVVRDGRIAAVGPRSAVRIPNGVRVIPAQGKTIIPGLWDMHGHLSQIEWGPAYLAAGVTSARDVGGERLFLTAFRDALANKHELGPRLFLAGLVDGDGPEGYGMTIAANPAEGRAVVDRYRSAGFGQMKLYSRLAPDVVAAIATRAHEVGMRVTGHVPDALSIEQAIEAGMDQFEHLPIRGALGSEEVRQIVQFLGRRGTVAGPTLAWDELLGRAPDTPVSSFEPGILEAPPPLAGSYNSVMNNTDTERVGVARRRALGIVKTLHDAGITVLAGTDSGVPGHSLLRTLELFVEAGMTPAEAIASATSAPAKFMGMEKDAGTIEQGKAADLLVLDEDPLLDISNIRKGRWVASEGRLFDCAALWKIAGFTPRP